jgi:biopolymer transport protein ExbD
MFLCRRSDEGVEVQIPVTPMLDMAFQLLIFFIFTYHPSEMEGQMEMAMAGGPGGPVNGAMDDPPLDDVSGSAVVVRVHTQQGDEAGAIVYPIEINADVTHGVANSIGELETHLHQMRTTGLLLGKTGATVELDRRLKWAFVVEVMDACKRSGLQVSLAAPADR